MTTQEKAKGGRLFKQGAERRRMNRGRELIQKTLALDSRYLQSNGNANKVLPEDRSVHEWYRFVLSFPPHLVRHYVSKFGISAGQRLLDPFCGTGTTLVECKKLGIPSFGIEAIPMACFATRVKTSWHVDPEGLLEHASAIAQDAHERLLSMGFDDEQLLAAGNEGTLRTLPPESMKLLLTGSISPIPLHKVLVLLDCIREHYDQRYHDCELLALAKAVTASISNLHFGPEVGVGPGKEDTRVISAWYDVITEISKDLAEQEMRREVPTKVFCSDARQVDQVLPPDSVDAVITSPPYPNEKDYTRTMRLESVILGFLRDRRDLRDLKRNLLRSNTRTVYKDDDDDKWIANHPRIRQLAEEIEARRISLGKTSGFERLYPKVTKLYFGGMARHFASLRAVLRPGARLAYVVGDQASYLRVMIRTGELLAEIATSLGYEIEGIDLFRTRLATATKEKLREEIVLLRWPGWRRRTPRA